MRIRAEGRETMDAFIKEGKPFLFTFWHNNLLLARYAFPGPPEGISAVIGTHHDGELIAQVMHRFGHSTVRGSTTRGGAMALRETLRELRGGRVVAFTPDGPRGPRHEAQMGVVQAAKMSGAPIVPMAFGASKKKF